MQAVEKVPHKDSRWRAAYNEIRSSNALDTVYTKVGLTQQAHEQQEN